MTEQSPPSLSIAKSRRSWRPQMSLRTMLVGFAFILFIVAHYAMVQEFKSDLKKQEIKYQKLEEVNKRIKKDFSILEVTDPNLVHFVPLPTFEPDSKRFRVYYPPNRKFFVKYATSEIPTRGFICLSSVVGISQEATTSGEDEIGILHRDGQVTISTRSGSTSTKQTVSLGKERERYGTEIIGNMVGSWDTSYAPRYVSIEKKGEPLEVARVREYRKRGESPDVQSRISNDSDHAPWGLLLWIEEVTPTASTAR